MSKYGEIMLSSDESKSKWEFQSVLIKKRKWVPNIMFIYLQGNPVYEIRHGQPAWCRRQDQAYAPRPISLRFWVIFNLGSTPRGYGIPYNIGVPAKGKMSLNSLGPQEIIRVTHMAPCSPNPSAIEVCEEGHWFYSSGNLNRQLVEQARPYLGRWLLPTWSLW